MAPADRNPNRRASPMPASDSETSRDEGFEPTTVAPMPKGEHKPVKHGDELTRRLDVSDNPGFAEGWHPEVKKPPRSAEGRRDPRRTDVYREKKAENPDVVGAPERTVVAPLPRRHEDVEPIPDAASTSGARVAAEAEARRQRRAEDEARRRDESARRDLQRRDARVAEKRPERRRDDTPDGRRDRPASRETDRELDLASERVPARERTTPAAAPLRDSDARDEPHDRTARSDRSARNDRDGAHDRDEGRRRAADRPESTNHGLVHQTTSVERVASDSPWVRLGVALRDVSNAMVVSTKESWTVLRRDGVKPFLVRMKPGAVRVWRKTRDLAVRLRIVAVTKAVELGLVKPKRLSEYEQHGDDRLDQSRVEKWRRFHKGKTSSSYLQDDE